MDCKIEIKYVIQGIAKDKEWHDIKIDKKIFYKYYDEILKKLEDTKEFLFEIGWTKLRIAEIRTQTDIKKEISAGG